MSFPVRLLCFASGDVATLEAHTYLELAAGIHFQAAMLRGICGDEIVRTGLDLPIRGTQSE